MLSIKKNPEKSLYVDLPPTIYQPIPQKKPRPRSVREGISPQKNPQKFLYVGRWAGKKPTKKPTKKPRRGAIRRNLGIGSGVDAISGFANMRVARTIRSAHTVILAVFGDLILPF